MKSQLRITLLFILLTIGSALAEESGNKPDALKPWDKERASYALGMHLAIQARSVGGDLDVDTFTNAINDVLQGKPLKYKESDTAVILNMARTNGLVKFAETNQTKVSYALGMRLGLQLQHTDVSVDVNAIADGVRDVFAGRQTKVDESELEDIFRQTQEYAKLSKAQKNASEGEAFLAKNAKAPGIAVLPDGLQYRVLTTGTGEIPKTNDLVFVKYRGTFIDGTEFDHNNHFLTRPDGGPKCWQDALQRMPVGSKWQIFVPPALGFGHEGDRYKHVGGNATLIYELELTSIYDPAKDKIGYGRVGHGLNPDNVQTNASIDKIPAANNSR